MNSLLSLTRASAIGLICLPLCALSPARAAELPGYERLTIEAPHRARLMDGAIWYPSGTISYKTLIGDNPVFVGTSALMGPAIKSGTYPLIVISHGSGGNIDGLGWLAGALAHSGAIVAGVNHQGTTSGDSSPRQTIRHWTRPQDVTALIDTILADPTYARHIDLSKIYSVGFSLGGQTVLSLAGARMNQNAFADYCARDREDLVDCIFLAKGGADVRILAREDYERGLRDSRIAKTVAVDPGFIHAMTEESLKDINTSLQVINLGTENERWYAVDVGENGADFASKVDDFRHNEIAGANHFTFLGVCKADGPRLLELEGEDPICDDPAGTDRQEAHKMILEEMRSFLFDPHG